jgi:hypothetical protein
MIPSYAEQSVPKKRLGLVLRMRAMAEDGMMRLKSAEDPYVSLDKYPLISMIHFLVTREEESDPEFLELKDMVKELRDTHKQNMKTQTNLMKMPNTLTS